jgi:hypothetical protein
LQAKKDDEDAIALLEKAKAAMAKYYEENGISLLSKEPEFTRSADDAPDATLSGKDNNKNAAKTILSLFAYIIEDQTDELANAKKDEAQSQADFEEEKATAEKLVDDLTEKKVTLEGIIAKRNEDKKVKHQLLRRCLLFLKVCLRLCLILLRVCELISLILDDVSKQRQDGLSGVLIVVLAR